MNKKQTIILWVGILIFSVIGLFPPHETYEGDFGKVTTDNIYALGLFVLWFIVAVVTGGPLVTFKDKKK